MYQIVRKTAVKLQHFVMKLERSNKIDLAMLWWESKFATVIIECSFKIHK